MAVSTPIFFTKQKAPCAMATNTGNILLNIIFRYGIPAQIYCRYRLVYYAGTADIFAKSLGRVKFQKHVAPRGLGWAFAEVGNRHVTSSSAHVDGLLYFSHSVSP